MQGDTAGRSAGEMAQRARGKIARVQRAADAGAAGEQATAWELDGLDHVTWRVLHDVRWPGRARATIDHVVVGPPGVFVIDSKNWSGTVGVRDGVLRQDGRSREKQVVDVAEAAAAVRRLVPGTAVHPVLCLVRNEHAHGSVRNVRLCSAGNVIATITSRTPVLSPEDVSRVTAAIRAGTGRTPERSEPRARTSRSPKVAPTRRATRRRSGPRLTGVLAGLALMTLVLAGLQTGLLFDAVSKVGEVVSGQVVPDEAPADEPGLEPVNGPNREGGQQRDATQPATKQQSGKQAGKQAGKQPRAAEKPAAGKRSG